MGETIEELEDDPNVEYAVPNWRAQAAGVPTDDPAWRRQWNLFSPWGINIGEAWTLAQDLGAPGGRGAVVAVLDSGVAYENRGRFRRAPDLRHSTFVHPFDFIDNDRHPNDSFGHGTHVSGTIAQTTGNGVATAGIAYNAKIMPLRVLDDQGSGDSAAIARAIRWAARYGADVINLSLEFPAEVRAAEIPDVIGALRYARRHGALVIGAAGNQADFMVAYPARATQVMAVGATTITGCQADYSNSGRDLDVVAPGGGADAPNSDSTWDSRALQPGLRSAGRSSSRPSSPRACATSGCRAVTRGRPWPRRTCPRSPRSSSRRSGSGRTPRRSSSRRTSRRRRGRPTGRTATAPGSSTRARRSGRLAARRPGRARELELGIVAGSRLNARRFCV